MKNICFSLDNYLDTNQSNSLSFHFSDLHELLPEGMPKQHRHNYYEIVLIEKGGGKHIIDFDEFNLEDYTISIVFPYQIHNLSVEKDAKGSIFRFGEELFCSEILRKELRAYCNDLQHRLNNLILSESSFKYLQTVFSLVKESISHMDVIRREQLRHLVKVIVLEVISLSKPKELTQQETHESDQYFSFVKLVDEHFMKCRFVSDYALKLGLSGKQLNALSKKYRGETALHVIHDRLLLEAKRMLIFSDYTHKEIAYELGFDSPSAFNKFIVKKENCTPSELQERLVHIYNR